MRLRRVRGPGRVVAGLAVVVLAVGGLVPGCGAGRPDGNPSEVLRPAIGVGETAVRVLQVNLCNSGRADCYAGGRAVDRAAVLVRQHRPDMVSLNEVCRGDVDVVEQALTANADGSAAASAFEPVTDRSSQEPVRCENGQEFGDGVLVVLPAAARGSRAYSGTYPVQDPEDVEQRGWACIDLTPVFAACTTHASSTSTTVALAQCRHLLTSVVPMIRQDPREPTILGADLNIPAGGSSNLQGCLPPGYRSTDDGAVQHVVVSPGATIRSREVLDMRGTTDHPGLLVDVVGNSAHATAGADGHSDR